MSIKKKEASKTEEKPIEYAGPFMIPEEPIVPIKETIVKTPVFKTKEANVVTVKVKVGTLHFEQGTFEKGSTFTVTRERLKLFDPADIEVLGE